MGLLSFFKKGKGKDNGRPRLGLPELAERLGVSESELAAVTPRYSQFTIAKRNGNRRTILAPEREFKQVQRRILRRVLALLVSHPAATGFEQGKSIVTNAIPHIGKPVVVRMDIRDFFTSTLAKRVVKFFRRIGWDKAAATRLTELCTHDDGLPQGAPTSPRLANLLNYRLDARLDRLAAKFGATYTRYADDLTFSFDTEENAKVRSLIRTVTRIVADEGYRLHKRRKLSVRRRHQQQRVTGLIVNDQLNLPRETRRRLRAIEHHIATGQAAGPMSVR